MNKANATFEEWFDCLQMLVLARTRYEFRDADAVRADYDSGRELADVAEEIVAEYGEDG